MSESQTAKAPEFGRLRTFFWPIHGFEMKKFLPMGLIMFCMLFVYTILRDVKDVLVVTAPGGGAPVLSFLKGWGVMPSAILFVVLYAKLTNIMSQEKIFYWVVSVFITFFAAFAFYLYPNQEMLHPSQTELTRLQELYPNLRFVFPVWGLWTYSLFYIMAELWGSVMVSLLFWQFANQVVRTNEAKRFYSLFGLIANFALIASGEVIKHFSALEANSTLSTFETWGHSLKYMMGAVVLCGLAAMILFRWLHMVVLTDKRYYDPAEKKEKSGKKKAKLGIGESLKYIFTNPYIGFIAILVMAYGVSINLIEVVWKDQIRQAFPNPNEYARFMGQFSQNTGIATILLIFFTKGIVRKFGWYVGAIVTPLITVITGGLFYGLVLFDSIMTPIVAIFGTSTAILAAWVGSIQNIMAKGTKYSQFDPTKEMAYIPLDEELRTKGKAAVDVIGGRLGKAAGGYTQQIVYIITATKDVLTVAPYFAGIVAVIVGLWVWAVGRLSTQYNALVGNDAGSKKAA